MKNNFYNKSFTTVSALTTTDVAYFFKKAQKMRSLVKKYGATNSLHGKIITALFYEPSTRTFSSFVAAAQRLGAGFIPNRDITSTSVIKGETLHDTIRVLAQFSDCIVLRHPQTGSVDEVSKITSVPIINGGDGAYGEHPAHALHDLWTIHEHFKKLDNLHIVMVGDLGHYRNVTSLAKLLALYNTKITFVSAKICGITADLRKALVAKKCSFVETDDLNSVVADADVLYVTRVKKEYMKPAMYKKIRHDYIVDPQLVARMKEHSVIMHPLPRVDEITPGVDNDHRAIYFTTQLENSLYGKMALLELILKK